MANVLHHAVASVPDGDHHACEQEVSCGVGRARGQRHHRGYYDSGSGFVTDTVVSAGSERRVIYVGLSPSRFPLLCASATWCSHRAAGRPKEKRFCICPVPTIQQKALQRFMDEGHFERHLNRMRIIYRQKREAIVTAIRELVRRQDRWH